MTPYWESDCGRVVIYNAACGDVLQHLTGIHACVTDPPYGLSFMGKHWDYDVPTIGAWRAVLNSLLPGAHLLSFAGTRTQHRMCVNIEDAGFEIRDMIAWVYGCLSSDTELLIDGKWEPYHKAIEKGRALCYNAEQNEFRWEQIQELVEYDYNDTAFRICGDHTDQIVSRNHRCLIEQSGSYIFALSETLEREARVPVLENVQNLLDAFPVPHQRSSGEKQILQRDVYSKTDTGKNAIISAQGQNGGVSGLWQENMEAERVASEGQDGVLLAQVQRQDARKRVGETRSQGSSGVDYGQHGIVSDQDDRCGESGMERRCNLLSQARELQADQVRPVSVEVSSDGAEGRVCDGASAICSACAGSVFGSAGGCASCEPRPAGQPAGEPRTLCEQSSAQAVRASRFTTSDLARVEPFHYQGKVWCIRVPSGAFVARRNGKVFVTGNSGFPKSLDVSKAIDKAAGAKRQIVGPNKFATLNGKSNVHCYGEASRPDETAPATDAAKQWQGWGTALKPALEPITVARKPLVGTVAENVLAHGTGAINVDGCRVEGAKGSGVWGSSNKTCQDGRTFNASPDGEEYRSEQHAAGRWPANLIHDGSDDVLAGFPHTTSGSRAAGVRKGLGFHGADGDGGPAIEGSSGSAARFFYCAKASKADRDAGLAHMPTVTADPYGQHRGRRMDGNDTRIDGKPPAQGKNHHPTVKPTDLMRYLCRLVTPKDGIILDPFMGSGSTGKAAVLEGFRFIGIERDKDYCDIAKARILHVLKQNKQQEIALV